MATDYAGNSSSQAFQVPAAGGSRAFTHDANDNLTSDGTRTFEWDAENRVVAVNVGIKRSEFSYDGVDRRIRIVEKENAVVVRDAQFLWAGIEIIEERVTTGEVNRFFADGEQHNGTAGYLTRDHLASIREVTSAAGALITRNDYGPYGQSARVAGATDSRFAYTGHYAHAPSGLVLAPYRAYDPTLGRWLSDDPAGIIDGPNLQAYVRSNPVLYLDSDGRNAAVGATVGFGFGGPLGSVVGATLGTLVTLAVIEGIKNWVESRRKAQEDEEAAKRHFNDKRPDRSPKDYRPKDRKDAPRPDEVLDDIAKTQDRLRKAGRPDQIDKIDKSKQNWKKSLKQKPASKPKKGNGNKC